MFDTYTVLLLGACVLIGIVFIYLILKKETSKKTDRLFMLFVLLILILLYIEIGKALFN